MKTVKGRTMEATYGNQVVVMVPIPMQHTVESAIVQPRLRYDAMDSADVVNAAGTIPRLSGEM